MNNKRNEMMYVTTYADDTGLFSETECDFDNMVVLEVPRWIVEEWYKMHEDIFKEQASFELDIPEEEVTFDIWFRNVYMCEDFSGDYINFYDFCIIKGVIPNLPTDEENVQYKVFYEDDNCVTHNKFIGTYNECRRWCKLHNWNWCRYDLELEIE